MKFRIAVVLLVVFGLSACSHLTCPTYAKKDVKQNEVAVEKENV